MNQSWKQWEGRLIHDQFQLQQYLGSSGPGVVFLTERSGKNPLKAAIKFIPVDSTNAETQLSRWISAAGLSHPHLLRVFETGRCRIDDAEFLYIVTEYADENLSQILLQRSLTAEETREMLDPVLDALLYLHSKSFIHSRIKPSNIMAVSDQLKISSDGICPIGAPGERVSLRASADVSPYDSPESATAHLSPANDVWSLGMSLVEILTQRLPLWDPADQRNPQLPESSSENLTQPFFDIASHALQRDPARRWSMGEIAARLQPNAQVHPAPVPLSVEPLLPRAPQPSRSPRMPSPPESRRTQKSPSSSPRYIIPAVAGALILAGIFIVPKLMNPQPQASQPSSSSGSAQLRVPAPVKSTVKTNSHASASSSPANSLNSNSQSIPARLRSESKSKPASANPGHGAVLSQVLPDVSAKARDTIHGTVKVAVRVHVGPAGNVTAADLDGPVPSKYFANVATQAARHWTFQAPESAGHSVPSEWLLRFYFTPSSTKAIPEQSAP